MSKAGLEVATGPLWSSSLQTLEKAVVRLSRLWESTAPAEPRCAELDRGDWRHGLWPNPKRLIINYINTDLAKYQQDKDQPGWEGRGSEDQRNWRTIEFPLFHEAAYIPLFPSFLHLREKNRRQRNKVRDWASFVWTGISYKDYCIIVWAQALNWIGCLSAFPYLSPLSLGKKTQIVINHKAHFPSHLN